MEMRRGFIEYNDIWWNEICMRESGRKVKKKECRNSNIIQIVYIGGGGGEDVIMGEEVIVRRFEGIWGNDEFVCGLTWIQLEGDEEVTELVWAEGDDVCEGCIPSLDSDDEGCDCRTGEKNGVLGVPEEGHNTGDTIISDESMPCATHMPLSNAESGGISFGIPCVRMAVS